MNSGFGIFGLIFSLLFFIIVWFVWLGSWINTIGQYFVESAGLNGIEALIISNLNIVILFAIMIMIGGFSYFNR